MTQTQGNFSVGFSLELAPKSFFYPTVPWVLGRFFWFDKDEAVRLVGCDPSNRNPLESWIFFFKKVPLQQMFTENYSNSYHFTWHKWKICFKKNLGKKQTPPGPKRRKLDHTCFRDTARLSTFFLRFFFRVTLRCARRKFRVTLEKKIP